MEDMILGKLELIRTERDSYLDAYYKADYEREELRDEVKRLRAVIASLKTNCKRKKKGL